MIQRLIALLLLCASLPAGATNYFVNNVTGSNSNPGTSPTSAWLDIHCTALQAGDVESLIWTGSDYGQVGHGGTLFCSNKAASSGTPLQPITVRGVDCVGSTCVAPNHCLDLSPSYCSGYLPRITVSTGQAVQLRDNVSYMQISYVDTYVTSSSGAGFLIGSSGFAGTVHHVLLDHVRVSYAGGDCISMEFADYFTVAYSEAFNCGQLDTGASDSAISVLAPTVTAGDDGKLNGCYGLPSDMVSTYGTAYRNCVVRNRCWYVLKGTIASDGNCIIFDDWWCSQFPVTNCLGVRYPFAGLIAENVCFSVDGRCVHVFSTQTTSGTTRVAYNTAYNPCRLGNSGPCNSTSGVMDALGKAGGYVAGGIQFDHNIVYVPSNRYGFDISVANGGAFSVFCNDAFGGTGVLHSDATAASIGQTPANIALDPHLSNPSADQIVADFLPTSSTPSPSGC